MSNTAAAAVLVLADVAIGSRQATKSTRHDRLVLAQKIIADKQSCGSVPTLVAFQSREPVRNDRQESESASHVCPGRYCNTMPDLCACSPRRRSCVGSLHISRTQAQTCIRGKGFKENGAACSLDAEAADSTKCRFAALLASEAATRQPLEQSRLARDSWYNRAFSDFDVPLPPVSSHYDDKHQTDAPLLLQVLQPPLHPPLLPLCATVRRPLLRSLERRPAVFAAHEPLLEKQLVQLRRIARDLKQGRCSTRSFAVWKLHLVLPSMRRVPTDCRSP